MGIDDELLTNCTVIPLPEQQVVRISGRLDMPSQAAIYDMSGRMLTTVRLQDPSENRITFTERTNGIYLLQVTSGTSTIRKKFNWIR
jgi:hypothetical protein